MELFKGQSLLEFTERFKNRLRLRRISSFFKVGRWILLSQSYEISRQTAHYFMQKVREAMKSSESHKMNDSV